MKQQETAKTILRVARKSFARHGYEGTSVRQITAAAGVNLGAVTYHFGSKRNLYEQVLESGTGPLVARIEEAVQSAATPTEQVGTVVAAYFGYLIDNPDLAQLMLQELALGRVPPDAALQPIRRILGALTTLVIRGQATGEFRAGDPRLLSIGIISQSVHISLVRRALKAVAGFDLQDPATRDQVIAHVTAFAQAGITGHRS